MIQVRILPKASLGLLFICSLSFTYKIDGFCDWDVFNCDDPYSIEQTLQFRCKSVDDCPVNFMCCSHKCFRHKICQPYKNIRQTPNVPSNNFEIRPGECDVVVGCDIRLPKAFTKSFECFQDNDCPDYYKCCFVSCYNHKVCQLAKGPFTGTSTGILTERSTSVTEIPSTESTVKEAVTTKSYIDGTRATAVSEAYLNITEATTVVESTLLEIITTKNHEESSTTIRQIDEGFTEPVTTTPMINTDTTTSKSLAEPTILTTQEITMQVTTTESLTELPVLTSSVEVTTQATISKTLTEPSLSTADVEASGDLELIDDDEDRREEVEDNAATTTIIPKITKLHHTKYFTEQATIKTTPFQSLSTELSIENNDIEGSGNSMTIEDDDEDNRNEKKNDTLITNTISSTSTITLQPIQSLDGLSDITTETVDFEITGDLEITEDDEDELNKGGIDITATVLKIISSSTAFKLTTPQQAESSKNLSETTVVTENQSLKESTRFLTENYEEIEKTKEFVTTANTTIIESIRNNETATLAPTHQISGTNDFKVVTLPPPIIESTELGNNDYLEANGNLGTVGTNEDKSNKEQNKNNTSFETNPTFTLITLQQAKPSEGSKVTEHTLIEAPPLRVSTEFTETVDFEASGDSEVIGDDEDMQTIKNYTTTTKLKENIEILTVTTTQRSASTQDTIEVTTKTNQSLLIGGTKTNFENDDSEASGDFEIIGDDEDERREHQEIDTVSKVLINDTIHIIQPETDDFEASGDLEIIIETDENEMKANLGN